MFTGVLTKLQKLVKYIVETIQNSPLSVFRIVFSSYFVWMHATLLVSIPVLFGEAGIPKDYFLNYYKNSFLQSIYNLPDAFFITLMIINIFLAVYYAFGRSKRIAMFGCWLCMGLIFIRIPISRSIHIPYLGHMMLLSLFIPDPKSKKQFNILDYDFMPKDVRITAWILFGGTYLASAFFKIMTVEWQQGKALFYVFQDIMPRQNFFKTFISGQPLILGVIGYIVLLIEGLGWLMMFNRKSRFIILTLSALFHCGILLSFRMGELSIGMLVFHVFLLSSLFEKRNSEPLQI